MFKIIIFVAFVIACVLGAPAPAPKPHYVAASPFAYSAYASPYAVGTAWPGAYAVSPYSYGYASPLGIGAYSTYGGYGLSYGGLPYAIL